jgi:iron complex transport system substrate-binding protein
MVTGPKIVTLLPAASEIVAALGFAEAIVGRSHECDFPRSILKAPVVSRPRPGLGEGSGRAIHDAIADLLARALSIYEVDLPVLASLAPDLVVTQTQCAVCAVDEASVAAALAGLSPSRPHLVSLAATSLAGLIEDIGRCAEALGAQEAAAGLCEQIGQRIQAIARRAAGAKRPRVACLEWLDPPMGAGNWLPELVRLAGGEALFGTAGQPTPWLDPAEAIAADPEVVVAMPCGFALARAEAELMATLPRLGWQGMAALRAGRVYVADGNAFFNRPGPRLVESLEILAEILHPERFRFGHEGQGWRRVAGPVLERLARAERSG